MGFVIRGIFVVIARERVRHDVVLPFDVKELKVEPRELFRPPNLSSRQVPLSFEELKGLMVRHYTD